MARRVFITAAEPSGDNHAAAFAAALRTLDPSIQLEGFGGAAMAAAGVSLLRETVRDAAMTVHGVKRVFEVLRLRKLLTEHHRAHKPDLHVCVDSSAMNLPFAQRAKRAGVPVLYYVAPQLWASREGRMTKLRADVDRLACILPFEESYFRSHGVNATFVGHPLFDELPKDRSPVNDPARFPTIGIIAGSRKSEVAANLPHLLDVARRIIIEFPAARFLLPTTPATYAQVSAAVDPSRFTAKQNAFDEFMPQCDLCLCKSGTSTLHVAAFGVPMIVVYRVSPILWHMLGRWLIRTKKIALVNILAGQIELVPEFIPWFGSNVPVADCAIELLKNPVKLHEQRAKLKALVATLDRQGASMNVARIAMEMMSGERRGFE